VGVAGCGWVVVGGWVVVRGHRWIYIYIYYIYIYIFTYIDIARHIYI
jgi:hypothetical protein